MFNSMIERVARAAWENSLLRDMENPEAVQNLSWADLVYAARADPIACAIYKRSVAQACSIITAMREPTTGMISDGAFQIFEGERISERDLAAAARVWDRMIKRAISENA